MIDRKEFNKIYQDLENETILELIELYLTLYQQEFLNIKQSLARKDFQDLSLATCKLKGMVSCFFDPVVTEQARRLEALTRNNDKNEVGIEALLDELEVNHRLLVEELERMKEELINDQK